MKKTNVSGVVVVGWLVACVCEGRCDFSSPGKIIAQVPGEKYDVLAVDYDNDMDVDVILAWSGGVSWFEQVNTTRWIRRDIVSEARESISFENGSLAIGSCGHGVELDGEQVSTECAADVLLVDGRLAYLTETQLVYGDQSYDLSEGRSLARWQEGLLIANRTSLSSFDAADSQFRTLVDGVFGGRSAHGVDDVAVFGSTLDDSVRYVDSEGAYLASESSHGVVSVFAADIDNDGSVDIVSACPDDESIRKYTNRRPRVGIFSTSIVDPAAPGAAAVALADVDGDSALDLIAATDEGILFYRNEDCVDDDDDNSKKKKRNGTNVTVIVVFIVVAVLALFAAAVFFCYSAPPGIKTQVQESIRKVFSRERFNIFEDDEEVPASSNNAADTPVVMASVPPPQQSSLNTNTDSR